MIAVQDAGDPDTAGRALQVEHEMGAVTGLAIPHLERRGARGTECRVMVLVTLGLKRLAPPDPFAAALLAGVAPGAARRVPGCFGGGGGGAGGGGGRGGPPPPGRGGHRGGGGGA